MHGLEDIAHRIFGRGRAETPRGVRHAGRFMAQRLHQPQHAVLARGRAEQHRADLPLAQFAGEIVEHRVARRLNILQQLLHQRVVMVGELLQHRETGLLLAIEIAAFQCHDFGGLVFAIDEGALQREIDEACDQVAVPDRDLAQHQRNARRRLQGRERLANALVGAIDLVQKQKARNAEILELAQDELQLRQLFLVRLADHDRGIDRRQCGAHVVRELDRTGTIDKSVAVAHESRCGGGQANAHLVVASFGAGIAYGSTGIDAAGAGIAPVRAKIASSSVVLPLWKGPTSAMHRGPRGLLTSCPIAASLFGARPLIGSAIRCSARGGFGKRENVAAVHRDAGRSCVIWIQTRFHVPAA